MHLGPYLLGPNDTPENGIYTGDAISCMSCIPDDSIDAFVTDPPYGTHTNNRPQWMVGEFSNVIPLVLPEMYRTGTDNAALYTFTSWKWMADWIMRASQYFRMQNFLIWDKQRHSGTYGAYSWQFHWEGIYYGIKGPRPIREYMPDVLRSKEVPSESMQKPVDVVMSLIRASTDEGDIVCDSFLGTGTTAVACALLGRRWLCFEIDATMAADARERVARLDGPLFVPEPEQAALWEAT